MNKMIFSQNKQEQVIESIFQNPLHWSHILLISTTQVILDNKNNWNEIHALETHNWKKQPKITDKHHWQLLKNSLSRMFHIKKTKKKNYEKFSLILTVILFLGIFFPQLD